MINEKETKNIRVEDIIPNRFQPRLNFETEGLNELSESIKQHGIIQPLVLRQLGTKYEIIAGERRYKASLMAGLSEVPAIIVDLNDSESAEVALVENIQRRELSAIEEARSYKNIIDLGNLKQDELAKRMGKNQSTVSNKLRLLNLDEEVQNALLSGKISERHARSLLSLKASKDQINMLNRILSERLNVRQTDDEVAKMVNNNDEEEIIDIIEDVEEKESPVSVNPFFNFTNLASNMEEEVNNEESPFIPNDVKIEEISNPFIPVDAPIGVKTEEVVKQNKFFSAIPFIKEEPELQPQMFINDEETNIVNSFDPMDTLPNYNNKEIYPQPVGIKNDLEPMYNNYQTMVAEAKVENDEFDPEDFVSIIKSFRSLIDRIEDHDYYIDTEEIDSEDYYQFTIKIDKERL